jgi:hypothetical protein
VKANAAQSSLKDAAKALAGCKWPSEAIDIVRHGADIANRDILRRGLKEMTANHGFKRIGIGRCHLTRRR